MSKSFKSLAVRAAVVAVSLAPVAALAALTQPVPEPGSWTLVGVGLVAAIAVAKWRRK